MSGANSTPLGRMNPAIGAGKRTGSSLLNPSYMGSTAPPPSSHSSHSKNMYNNNISNSSAAKSQLEFDTNSNGSSDSGPDRKKRRRSRWQGSEKEKTFIPGMPTVLPSNMNKDQEEAYLLQLQIEELSRRLRSNDLGIPLNPEDRSPSPEPIYNNEGKRLNTREYRTRKKLEDDRHAIITKMQDINPEYKPPADYKPPIVKVSDKVMIPQEEHPDINFVGLLIGPRGNTLKSMEKDTGGKIIIRGKGSVKEGKVGRKDGGPMPGEDEPLHAYVTASNPEAVKKAVDRIKEIIRQGVEVPEGQNDLRRMQLRELALLNGTLRENDGPRCTNCGSTAHKLWQCPEKPNVTNNVVCSSCGGAGHIMKDCRQRKPGQGGGGDQTVHRQKIDEEYMSLMAELGEGPPPPQNKPSSDAGNRGGGGGRTSPQIRSLFDTPVAPPRAIMAPPAGGKQQGSGNQMRQNMNNSNMNMGMNMNNMGPNNMNKNSMGPNNMNQNNMGPNNMNQNMGPNMRNSQQGNNNSGNWGNNGPNNQQQFNSQTNRLVLGGNNQNQQQQQQQQPGFNRPPPMGGWQNPQMNQQNAGFNQGPPPNLLSAPPPPPPPTNNSQNNGPPGWMNQGGMNNVWGQPQGGPPPQGAGGPPQGMGGCPPPGPVPAPRPVGPPPSWGWNGPSQQQQQMGPRPTGGNQMGTGIDLGALLSAPPPPPSS